MGREPIRRRWIACLGMILFASYSGEFGGAERLLIQFAGAFEGRCCIACPEGLLADAARAAGFTAFPLRRRSLALRGGLGAWLSAALRLHAHGSELRRLAEDLGAEAVIAWGMRPALALLLPRPRWGRPVVFQHNDLLPDGVVGRAVRLAAARADRCVALSRAIASDLDPSGRVGVTVVHPGVDVGRFEGRGSPVSPPEALLLGAITGWKRPDLALEAVALVRRWRPQLGLRLRVVGAPLSDGGDALLASLQARASLPDLAGAVEFAGAVLDPAAALARATCLLHCAEREPFGMAVLEALAAGRPVVAPAAAGPLEIVGHVDQVPGRVYAPGDAEAAARALVEVVTDPAQAAAMGAAGRERARREFGIERARREYRKAVEPVLGGAAPAATVRDENLALVTVTRNSARELHALVTSLERHLPGARLIVVDCASQDQTLDVASAAGACVIALDENVGFGRGSNRGVALVQEPVTALVNPDIELVDDSLAALAAEALRRDRPERLLAPLLLYPDGSRQDSVHPAPGSPADLVRSVVPPAVVPARVVPRRLGVGPELGFGVALAPWRSARPRRVGWAVGAALVAPTDVLRRLGPFDQRIFMYGEDLDLGLRAAAAGVETWFWPHARVVHHRAHSTAREFGGEAFEQLARARHDVVARRLGAHAARLDDRAQAVTFRSRAALKRALDRPAERERRQLDALRRVRRSRD